MTTPPQPAPPAQAEMPDYPTVRKCDDSFNRLDSVEHVSRKAYDLLLAHCSRLKAERDAAEAAALERAAKVCDTAANAFRLGEQVTEGRLQAIALAAAIRALIAPPSKT